MLTDGKGIPLSVAVDAANRHDKKLVKGTIDAIIIERPSHKVIQNIVWIRDMIFLMSENWLKNMAILAISGEGEKKT